VGLASLELDGSADVLRLCEELIKLSLVTFFDTSTNFHLSANQKDLMHLRFIEICYTSDEGNLVF
jgi:hypothetical protein